MNKGRKRGRVKGREEERKEETICHDFFLLIQDKLANNPFAPQF